MVGGDQGFRGGAPGKLRLSRTRCRVLMLAQARYCVAGELFCNWWMRQEASRDDRLQKAPMAEK